VVDLAGSERLSKTGSEGVRLKEAQNINKSIAALSNCISVLASDKPLSHVPFRDSKLTRLLTDSLGGNSKTTICACIGPSLDNYEESYSTLLFATRAMSVRTYVRLNERIESATVVPSTPDK
jgi:S-methylmethionine-dependent homocysteine/selenocysteine methylase